MKRYGLSFLVFLLAVIPAFTQTRSDIKVYIAPVNAAERDQAAYFQENFASETAGAGYTLADNAREADYTLKLEVKPNIIVYDDGSKEQAPPDEAQYILEVALFRNEDDVEIVEFAYAFDTTDEMYDFNLYLLYEAMANVPLTKLDNPIDGSNNWRDKWLYIRASFDYPITFYQLMEPSAIWGDQPGSTDTKRWQALDHKISPFPAVTFGFELQYLNWMSTEFSFNLSFSDPMSKSLIPAIQIEQKFPIKPAKHFMIEPYVAVSFPVNTSPVSKQFPIVGVGGGCQFGVKGGNMGAFFLDLNYIYFLGDVVMKNGNQYYPNPDTITYRRFVVGMGIGYKVGFFNRKI